GERAQRGIQLGDALHRAQLRELVQELVAVGRIEWILVLQLCRHQFQEVVHRQAAEAAAGRAARRAARRACGAAAGRAVDYGVHGGGHGGILLVMARVRGGAASSYCPSLSVSSIMSRAVFSTSTLF